MGNSTFLRKILFFYELKNVQVDKQVDKQVDNGWIMAGFMGFDDIPCLWWRFVMIGYKLACRSSTFLRGLFRAYVSLH
jgi:hypothetical protein